MSACLQALASRQLPCAGSLCFLPATYSSIDDLKFSNRDKKTANINKTIMASISTIMAYIRQGSKPASKKRLKLKGDKEGRGSAEKLQAPKVAVVPDEDIFDDAGECLHACCAIRPESFDYLVLNAWQFAHACKRMFLLPLWVLSRVCAQDLSLNDVCCAGDYDLAMRAQQDVK